MIKNGVYSVWFRTPLGEGTGLIQTEDGTIRGGDSFTHYDGTYDLAGDRFSAVVKITRHTEGPPTVFGRDDLTLRLEGLAAGAIATCTGTADQAPGVTFEATLIPSQNQPAAPEPSARKFDASRVPKLPRLARGR